VLNSRKHSSLLSSGELGWLQLLTKIHPEHATISGRE